MTRCTKCHALGEGVESARCLDCHGLLKQRIEAGRGLHARPGHETCTRCHSDHQGREYEMIRWPGGQENFRHAETGYELRASHAKLACRDCHQARYIRQPAPLIDQGKDLGRTFLGLDSACGSCHEDKHDGSLGEDCARCHDESVWKPAPKFDHARTDYPLDGRHLDIACARCHEAAPAFPPLTFAQCGDCHKDPHAGVLGADCSRCHTTLGWRRVTTGEFDHDKTRFPLLGAHRTVTCARCHVSGRSVAGRLDCDQCHRDVHRGAFAGASERTDCSGCHTAERFVPSTYGFTQHAASRFPLTGAHRAVPCADCHGASVETASWRWESLDCAACHPDVHEATYRDAVAAAEPCRVCHRTESWTAVQFDHGTTGLALEGAHAEASCSACHAPLVAEAVPGGKGRAFPAYRLDAAPRACAGCHRDPHAGQFAHLDAPASAPDGATAASPGTFCLRCHNTTRWPATRFDHDRDSRYPLEGAHEKVACAQCHPRGADGVQRFRPLGTECKDCHASTLSRRTP